jgi:hypothetical protein
MQRLINKETTVQSLLSKLKLESFGAAQMYMRRSNPFMTQSIKYFNSTRL